MQYRNPVGFRPSGKTWPRWASHRRQSTSGRIVAGAYFSMETIADPAELSMLRKALLEYCRQDTLGLVRLLEMMRAMEAEGAKG